jgi:hypothetical protein
MRLAPFGRLMWIAPKGPPADAPAEQVLPHLEAIAQFTDELRARLGTTGNGADGVDGIEGLVGLHRRLKALLDAIPADALARTQADVAAFQTWLERVRAELDALARLKAAL